MLPDTPLALRLVRASGKPSRLPAPPLGGARWDDAAPALCVLLEADGASVSMSAASVACQLPDPATLPRGTLVLILPHADTGAGALGRLFGGGKREVPRPVRCSALLARGYTRIGAGVDAATRADLAWGYVADQSTEQVTDRVFSPSCEQREARRR